MKLSLVPRVGLVLMLTGPAFAADAPIVPATRPELKQALENSKRSTPRLPLPPPTAEETRAGSQGPLGLVNNARMRRLYLTTEPAGGRTREPDPAMSLDPAFKTMFFWIVSRANNCTYCMGHQESKLSAAGVSEDRVAALDGDWSDYSPAERAAFAFTRKLTTEPQRVGASDLDALRPYYRDLQILEILFTVAGNNATNRWTGALAIPQEPHRVYLTPTSPKYEALLSQVAPLDPSRTAPACARPANRGALESRAEVEAALAACRTRSPRLPLVDEAEARAALPDGWPSGPLPQWVRLLANFPKAGVARAESLRASEQSETLTPRLKAQIAWISARHDRAWYALGHARARLAELGVSDDAIFALGDADAEVTAADRAALDFTRKLTVDPALIDDDDFTKLRALYSDREVAELVYQITNAAFFNRLTEVSGLRLEDGARL